MPYHHQIIKDRLPFVLDKIKAAIHQRLSPLDMEVYLTPEPVPYHQKTTGEKRKVLLGESWGKLWDCGWFHFTGTVPENFTMDTASKEAVLLIDINGELCVFNSDGNPVQGLTNVSSEYDFSLGRPGKIVYRFEKALKAGDTIDLWADAGCNDLFGKYQDSGIVRDAYIAVSDREMEQLFYDFEVLLELLQRLPESKARYHRILLALNEASGILREFTTSEAKSAREILAPELNKTGGDPSLKITAIGHAHIDLAWLWPIRETIRKGARTFSTVLRNMERYPEYRFGASQAQLYLWMKEHYPALYEQIRERIQEGRWEVQGAMWVEADTNVSGGESLVRQVLYAKRFFKEEFGQDIRNLWLPDVFGYTAALPQILKKSGVDYFMTIKLSWSKINKHPHHTFWWKGLDGSSVLAHMPPEGTYNSSAAPRAIVHAEQEFLDKGVSDECLLLFGIGDGGGGPGEEHLERLTREKDLNGLAPVSQGFIQPFFDRISQDSSLYKTWQGELYLECHQGTYTSQSKNKRYNRKMELALRELEFAAVLSMLGDNGSYPKAFLDKTWREVLLYQFHDILPGSSITRVYNESTQRYAGMLDAVETATAVAFASLLSKQPDTDLTNPIGVINSLSWERKEWLNHKGSWIYVTVPSMGYTSIPVCGSAILEGQPGYSQLSCSDQMLENDLFKVCFAANGFIGEIVDKETGRAVIAEGALANGLTLYDDPGDAWDFPMDYDQRPGEMLLLQDTSSYMDGPRVIRASTYKTATGKSILEQKVILTLGSKRIDFITNVDWQESSKMLRTSFPVNIFAQEATCEIQFGNIQRPTHRNTSWDMAKYEVCAHKWVDISQGDYGVALLNDCKYGHKLLGNVMDMDLLRSSNYPDPVADRGRHQFTYSLYPHPGDYRQGGVVRAAYELNAPLQVMHNAFEKVSYSFLRIENGNIILESVKKAEDSEDIILRLYEAFGSGTTAKIELGFEAKDVRLVNMLEQAIPADEALVWRAASANSIELQFKPFEIHTVKLSI